LIRPDSVPNLPLIGGPAIGSASIPVATAAVLVLLSILVASLAAFGALIVAERLRASRTAGGRRIWFLWGTGSLASGSWAMQFVGVLVCRLPIAPLHDPFWMVASVIPVLGGSAVAIWALSHPAISQRRLHVAGLGFSIGLIASHFVGRQAIPLEVTLSYDPVWFGLSVAAGYLGSTMAVRTRLSAARRFSGAWVTGASAAALGLAISGIHYAALAAVRVVPDPTQLVAPPAGASIQLVVGTLLLGSLVPGLAVVGTALDKRLAEARALATTTARRHRAADQERHRMTTAVEHAVEAIIVVGLDGKIEYANPAFERTLGHPEHQVLGRRPWYLSRRLHPAGYLAQLEDQVRRGNVWTGELVLRRRDGTHAELAATVSPVRDHSGAITHFVAVGRDVTDQRALETQLQQAQKLEAIGQLAAGIAHEINTPTQYVGDNVRFLRDAFQELSVAIEPLLALHRAVAGDPRYRALVADAATALQSTEAEALLVEIPTAIDHSLEGIHRVAVIVRAMKEFSHPSVQKKAIDLNRAIESTITVSTNEWKYVADVETDLDPDLPAVPCVPGEINRVLLNLIVNAAHAIAEVVGDGAAGKGRIVVSTRVEGGRVVIRVQDSGAGIPMAIRGRIFEPFFTTKGVGRGTGQGLSIAYNVITRKHGGTLSFETEEGSGSTFIIRLPLEPDREQPVAPVTSAIDSVPARV
jgi:PAS domain S-box-containing protein